MSLIKRFNISIFKISEERNYLSTKGLFLQKSNELFKKYSVFLLTNLNNTVKKI